MHQVGVHQVGEKQAGEDKRRLSEEEEYEIDDVIEMEIIRNKESVGDEQYASERVDITLTELTENKMTFQIEFKNPGELTKDVSDPDILHLYLSRNDIFIDSETFSRIPLDFDAYIPIVPQYSDEELEQIQ